MFVYYPQGVCSQMMEIELDGDTIKEVVVTGGCHGNLQAVSKLVQGMKVDEAIARLEGIRCGFKPTSCPDQLAKALKKATGR
ncbi:MAG: TIGR03905 family TSCPD domain-containing protein [Mogibacterium sp.]|nr:TIGR03905 family TSCPD domain-containing protein [Mogibacterium sp.]